MTGFFTRSDRVMPKPPDALAPRLAESPTENRWSASPELVSDRVEGVGGGATSNRPRRGNPSVTSRPDRSAGDPIGKPIEPLIARLRAEPDVVRRVGRNGCSRGDDTLPIAAATSIASGGGWAGRPADHG